MPDQMAKYGKSGDNQMSLDASPALPQRLFQPPSNPLALVLREIDEWGNDEREYAQPPPPATPWYPLQPPTPNYPPPAYEELIPPHEEQYAPPTFEPEAQMEENWDDWAQNMETQMAALSGAQNVMQHKLLGSDQLFPQLAKRVAEAENAISEHGKALENRVLAIENVLSVQEQTLQNVKTSSDEMAKKVENNQRNLVEVAQKVMAIDGRPPQVILQVPPEDATQSGAMVAEINRILQEMREGIQAWPMQAEKKMEEQMQTIRAQLEQHKMEQSARLLRLEEAVTILKCQQEVLHQEHLAETSELQRFGVEVHKAFRGIMQKIDRRMEKMKNLKPDMQFYANLPEERRTMLTKSAPIVEAKPPNKQPARPPLKIDRTRRSAGKPVFPSNLPSGNPGNFVESRAEIRAIGTTPMSTHEGLTIIPPQILSLVLGKGPGQFSGQRADWAEWKRKFLRFVEEIEETVPSITKKQLLAVLRQSLDPGSQAILETTLLSNPDVEFTAFWARLEMEMGSEDVEELRTKWHALRLKHQGSLKLADWRNFIGEFLRLKALIGGNEDEAKAILMRVLPIEFRKKILQEEDRKTQNQLVLDGLADFSTNEVFDLVKSETGITPQSVVQRGSKMVVGIVGAEEKERVFQLLDRERIMGGGMVSVKREASILLASDIDLLMKRWLTVEDKARLRDGFPTSNPPQQTRWQREVDAQPLENSCAKMQEVKVDTRTKFTQVNFSSESKKTDNAQPPKGNGSKGGRGRGAAPHFTPTSTPQPSSSMPNFAQTPPAQPQAYGAIFEPPPVQSYQWQPTTGSAFYNSYQPYSPSGFFAKGGKGEKGGKSGKGTKGGKGGH